MMLLFILLLDLCLSQSFEPVTYDDVKNFYNSVTITKEEAKKLLHNFKEYMNLNVFKDIYKSPPTDQGVYYHSFDVDTEIDRINSDIEKATGDINKLEFVQNFFKFTELARDGHFVYQIPFGTNYDVILINKFSIKVEEKIRKLYYDNKEVHGIILSGQEFNNKQYDTRNEEEVFGFIQDLADHYIMGYNNPHARFNELLMSENLETPLFARTYDLSKEPISISIKFSDSSVDKAEEIFLKIVPSKTENVNESDVTKLFKNIINNKNKDAPLNWKDSSHIVKSLIKNYKNRKANEESPIKYLNYDAALSSVCMIFDDGTYKMNVFWMNSFVVSYNGKESNPFKEYTNFLSDCTDHFNDNEYDVVIHMYNNGGGYVAVSDILRYAFFPNVDTVSMPGTLRQSNISDMLIMDKYYDTKTCGVKEMKQLNITDMYGNGIDHNVYELSYLNDFREYIEDISVLNKTKDQVVVLTDATCFSACSMFTKPIIENDLAVVYTYGGNVYNKSVIEISLNPTSVLENKNFFVDGIEYLFYPYIDVVNIPWFETFSTNEIFRTKDFNELKVEQFVATEGNGNIDDFYPVIFDLENLDTNLDQFLGTYIPLYVRAIDKMKTDTEDSIITEDSTCESKIENMVMGKNSTGDCVNMYCKRGYSYDKFTNECKEYKCMIEKGDSSTDNKKDGSTDNKNKSSKTETLLYLVLIILIIFI